MKTPQYLHVFACESNYSHSLLSMLDQHISLDQHVFLFGFGKIDKQKSDLQKKLSSRILHVRNPFHVVKVLFSLHKFKWVYFHYLSYDPTLLFWFLNKKRLQKSTWVVWGNDIYSYYKRNKNIKTRIYEYLRRRIIPVFPEIAAFVEEDVDFVRKNYSSEAEYVPILYPIPVNLDNLKSIPLKKQDDFPVFLLGNSADPSNRHIEVLEALSKHRNARLKIYCPLSYGGSPAYKKQVTERGKRYFGDNFIALTELLDAVTYAKLLSEVDVALMNHNRQQGLGNILALLYLGKKVYMRTSITSYPFFLRNQCEVFDIENIKSDSLDEIKKMTQRMSENKAIVESIISEKNYLHLWQHLLNKH
ncbi:MAG: TDP-N-acetylfucosamine:lipid II N-acetylfucosaminyltransferase [Paludibacter sp.]|nr:TDP-N-acetylfucosamine:lipid II N-acetylfucosaminyltransferase [Paludibacter sp.]MDD4198263.1 TDP-N-acetylfucosamine:lipid II N-acetylfucosaminyltransferase [Paludibacter sp.]MDD4428035.1 TDP-N-acetylfucosamine:lipid II N-acetylfucosaminyltransferase [Paludibacter sp.]